MPRIRPLIFPALGLVGVLLATLLAYYPGLAGGLLFDDHANLPAIGAFGPIDDWATFWRYITSGNADPTGRPLALLSFLVDARNWPADPRPFLTTNLILHLFNGLLLALLLRALGGALPGAGSEPDAGDPITNPTALPPRLRLRINLAAVLGAGLWLLHPLMVSTTLYIVQREAMLPATFVLLGLLLWLRGRRWMLAGHAVRGGLWLASGLGACTALAVLGKANGILLPALALVIEYCWLRPLDAVPGATHHDPARKTEALGDLRRAERRYRIAMRLFAWLPTAVIALYLFHTGWSGITEGVPAHRPWTLVERLLTEPRMLITYLGLLWLPRPFTTGLFNDQIIASSSLLTPWTTLPCLLMVISLIVGGWLIRNRQPALATAVLFFFVGQSLESSTIALELYFEHRNYLPAMLMFWPLALCVCGVRASGRANDAKRRPAGSEPGWRQVFSPYSPLPPQLVGKTRLVFGLLLLAGIGLMTHARASLWGNPHDQALLWARLNPHSPRAQAYAAQAEMAAGRTLQAIARLRPIVAAQTDEVQLTLNLFAAECTAGDVSDKTLAAAEWSLSHTRNTGSLLLHWFQRMIGSAKHPVCPTAGPATVEHLLDAAMENPRLAKISGRAQDLRHLKGLLALQRGNADQALAWFNSALDVEPRIAAALKQSSLLGANGFPQQGLAHLAHFDSLQEQIKMPAFGMPRIHAWVLGQQGYWQHELQRMRNTLQVDVAKKLQAD